MRTTEDLEAKIAEYEEHLKGATVPEDRTALLMMLAGLLKILAALREKEVLIMRGEHARFLGLECT